MSSMTQNNPDSRPGSKTRVAALKSAQGNNLVRMFTPSSLKRLIDTIPIFQADLDALIARDSALPGDPVSFNWAESAGSLLDEAVQAVRDGEPERGWRSLKAADRMMYYGMARVDPTSLDMRALAIVTEASDPTKAVTRWRIESIKGLLKDERGKLISPVNVTRLVEAKRLLDEHQDNIYQRLSILKSRLNLLSAIGLLLLIIWWGIAPQVPLTLPANDPLSALAAVPRRFWEIVIFAGVLGGLLSAFTSAISGDIKKSNIPAVLSTETTTYARLIVSALSAVTIIIFLGSGIVTFPQQNSAFIISLALISGFSDRLLLNAIEKVAKAE